MALSEEEQRLLEQMEAALEAEDPRLADALRGSQRGWYRRRVVISAVVFALGITVLVAGMEVHPLVSVLGFLIMLAATVVGVTAWRQPGGVADPHQSDRRHGGRSESDILGRLDERWRRGDDDVA
jgi:hypothetical protein